MIGERYVVYCVDKTNNDDKSMSSDSESITFTDQNYVDLHKTGNGNGYCIAPSSPVLSSTTTDKWDSYWTKRERCCCFCNCFMTVALVILSTFVILVTKGILLLHLKQDYTNVTKGYIFSPDVTPVQCATIKPDIQVLIFIQ